MGQRRVFIFLGYFGLQERRRTRACDSTFFLCVLLVAYSVSDHKYVLEPALQALYRSVLVFVVFSLLTYAVCCFVLRS